MMNKPEIIKKGKIILVCVFTAFITQLSAQVLTQDSLALVALYDSTNGDNWSNNSGWKSGPVSTWYGVTLSGNRVSQIILNGNNLSGKLPPAIGDLTEVGVFYINQNAIGDTITSRIGDMANLSSLALSNNSFSGKFPAEIGKLSNLINLYADGNAFSDTIPSQLGNLSALKILDLKENQFEGDIPASLGNLASITTLNLKYNNISGSIPEQLGRLSSIDYLDLSNNQLTGHIPDSLANIASITSLDLSYNQLDGPIPQTFGDMISIGELSLSHNRLDGSIPASLGNVSIQSIDLGHNQLTGPIPGELGNIDNMTGLYLENNQISGPIPENLFNASKLRYVYLSQNQIFDTLAVEWTNLPELSRLRLDHNQLYGTIPAEFGGALQISQLRLNHNQLEGEIPFELSNNNHFNELYLNDNNLNHMPDMSDGRLRSSTEFYIHNNMLDFADIEPNIDLTNDFEYAPQGWIGEEESEMVYAGDSIRFSVNAGGSANTYHWFKDSVKVYTSADTFFALDNIQIHDAAEYYCTVTNSIVEDLTLFSYPLLISVIDTTAPAVPQELSAVPGDKNIILQWNAIDAPDSVYYKIYMDETPEPTTLIDSTEDIGDTSRVITGLVNNSTYYLRIKSVDWSGNESGFSAEVQATPVYIDSLPPESPKNLSGVPGIHSVTLTWTSVEDTGDVYYRIYMDTLVNPQSAIDSTSGSTDTTITLTDLKSNTTYYCRVSAVDEFNNESEYSNEVAVTTEPTGISRNESALPEEFTLEQNYPNPFNPVTNIRFALPHTVHVRIEVYDLLGRQVGVWLDAFKQAGFYNITIDARTLPSGVYFYRLKAGDFQQVRRMILMR